MPEKTRPGKIIIIRKTDTELLLLRISNICSLMFLRRVYYYSACFRPFVRTGPDHDIQATGQSTFADQRTDPVRPRAHLQTIKYVLPAVSHIELIAVFRRRST